MIPFSIGKPIKSNFLHKKGIFLKKGVAMTNRLWIIGTVNGGGPIGNRREK
jgi:hypothetical protein